MWFRGTGYIKGLQFPIKCLYFYRFINLIWQVWSSFQGCFSVCPHLKVPSLRYTECIVTHQVEVYGYTLSHCHCGSKWAKHASVFYGGKKNELALLAVRFASESKLSIFVREGTSSGTCKMYQATWNKSNVIVFLVFRSDTCFVQLSVKLVFFFFFLLATFCWQIAYQTGDAGFSAYPSPSQIIIHTYGKFSLSLLNCFGEVWGKQTSWQKPTQTPGAICETLEREMRGRQSCRCKER